MTPWGSIVFSVVPQFLVVVELPPVRVFHLENLGSIIFVSVITVISIIAKLGQIEFKKTFPMAFIFFFLL